MKDEIGYHPGMRFIRLSPKNQLTIPVARLRQLGWQRGSTWLRIEPVGNAVHIRAVEPERPEATEGRAR